MECRISGWTCWLSIGGATENHTTHSYLSLAMYQAWLPAGPPLAKCMKIACQQFVLETPGGFGCDTHVLNTKLTTLKIPTYVQGTATRCRQPRITTCPPPLSAGADSPGLIRLRRGGGVPSLTLFSRNGAWYFRGPEQHLKLTLTHGTKGPEGQILKRGTQERGAQRNAHPLGPVQMRLPGLELLSCPQF